MYCLTRFFRGGGKCISYHENEDVLYGNAQKDQTDPDLGMWAWRIVNTASGVCTLYWKEGENANDPCYR